jgi:hypothetical protein
VSSQESGEVTSNATAKSSQGARLSPIPKQKAGTNSPPTGYLSPVKRKLSTEFDEVKSAGFLDCYFSPVKK